MTMPANDNSWNQGLATSQPVDAATQTYIQGGGTVTDPNFGGTAAATSTASQSATATVDAWATSVGLGSLSPWINQQIQTLAGQGLAASDIYTQIGTTINTAPGFDQIMPGYNQRIKNGYTNTDANTGAGIAGYMAYTQQLQAMAETAGLVPGTLTPTDIGNAWAGDVSTSEMSDRITTEYTNAVNALPAVQGELQNYGYTQSLSPGQLASYYLNPENTTAQLQQQFNSAVAGSEGKLTGFGEIGQSQAYALQAFLSNGGQNNLSRTLKPQDSLTIRSEEDSTPSLRWRTLVLKTLNSALLRMVQASSLSSNYLVPLKETPRLLRPLNALLRLVLLLGLVVVDLPAIRPELLALVSALPRNAGRLRPSTPLSFG